MYRLSSYKLIKALGVWWYIKHKLTSIALAKVTFSFKWYDLWIGVFYNKQMKALYICPFLCCAIKIDILDGMRQARKRHVKQLKLKFQTKET